MSHLPADRLEYKYRHEIHANEVEILPYYIANLNVEYTYKELTGRYLEFPNLCFVDTLDNMDWQGRQRRGGATADGAQPGRRVRRELDTHPGTEREARQRHHRQPAVQRQSAERERQ